MIKEGHVITLNNNKYMVIKKMNFHNIMYLYLVTIEKPVEMLIVTENEIDGKLVLEEIKDNDELDYVLSQFSLNLE